MRRAPDRPAGAQQIAAVAMVIALLALLVLLTLSARGATSCPGPSSAPAATQPATRDDFSPSRPGSWPVRIDRLATRRAQPPGA